MPSNVRCYVKNCRNNRVFRFPKASRQIWLDIIGRPDDDPKPDNGLCADHFTVDDIVTEGFASGVTLTRKRLRANAIPTQNLPKKLLLKKPTTVLKEFKPLPPPLVPFNKPVACISSDSLPAGGLKIVQDYLLEPDVIINELDCESTVVVVPNSNVSQSNAVSVDENRVNDVDPLEINSDQRNIAVSESTDLREESSNRRAKYDIHDYKDEPEVVAYLTGLETYFKFMVVFQSLRTDLFDINYRDCIMTTLSLENQLFLSLWKLKRNTPDFELGLHFGISQAAVSNIFISFVLFMTEQWGKINSLPSRSLTDEYMPDSFKRVHPCTKANIDGTEVQTANSGHQETSLNKNKITIKVEVDDDVCDKGDLILPDSGFNIQDIIAPKAFLKVKDNATLMEVSIITSEKVPIERLIEFTKTYEILAQELNSNYVSIASEIFYVCVMLSNFRENIISLENR